MLLARLRKERRSMRKEESKPPSAFSTSVEDDGGPQSAFSMSAEREVMPHFPTSSSSRDQTAGGSAAERAEPMQAVLCGDVAFADPIATAFLRNPDLVRPPLSSCGRMVYAPSGTLDKGEPQTRLQLMLEEALYLMGREGGVGLALVLAGRDARRMSEAETLCYCRRRKPNFDVKYAVYQHLTRRGYVVKPGLLYGVDYVAYEGPPHAYHSKYAVVAIPESSRASITWSHLQCVTRIMPDVSKWLLVCGVHENTGEVMEVLIRPQIAQQPDPRTVDVRRRRGRRQKPPSSTAEPLGGASCIPADG